MAPVRDVQDFVRLSHCAGDLDALRTMIGDIPDAFGFRFFLLSHHVNVVRANIVQFSNYPEDWSNAMRRKSHFAIDPVVRACQKTAAPFLWSELDQLINLSAAQKDILAGAARAGMGAGVTIPFHVPGECTGSGSFAVAKGRALDERIIPSIQYVACFAFERARRLTQRLGPTPLSVTQLPGLTDRQLDCIVL